MPAENTEDKAETEISKAQEPADSSATVDKTEVQPPKEVGGRGGLNPTRYGDWEKAGRCIDF